MPPLPLSFNEQTIKSALNAHDAKYHVVTEPVARNSRPYDGRPTCCGNNNCMPICPIGAMYNGIVHVEKAEQAGAKLIDSAVVYKLETGPDKRIVAAIYKDKTGADHRVEGKYFVLAANGIETPKILLMSANRDFPNGVANSSDMVGRNLMDHPGGVSFYASEKLWPGRGPQEMTSLIGFRDGPFRATEAAKIHLSNMSRINQETQKIFKAGKLMKPAELDSQIRDRSRYVQFDCFHEILPQPENRIVPSKTATDAIGIPRPEITYAIDDYVKRGAVHTREVYATAAQVLAARTSCSTTSSRRQPHHRLDDHGRRCARLRRRQGLPHVRPSEPVHLEQRDDADRRHGERDADDRGAGAAHLGHAEEGSLTVRKSTLTFLVAGCLALPGFARAADSADPRRSSAANISPSPATAWHVTPRRAASRSRAASACRCRSSARSIRATSRPTRTPASASGPSRTSSARCATACRRTATTCIRRCRTCRTRRSTTTTCRRCTPTSCTASSRSARRRRRTRSPRC
jgi:choline dehydrogenase-like flavoprotein